MSRWLAEKSSSLLGARTSRRGFLVRAAMVGTALAVNPVNYVLRPGTAYAAICGCAGTDCDCGSACCDGYTEFCCVMNNGVNACPPGTFEAGWWRADGSIYCDGPRYYVDCNIQCGNTSYGCQCGAGDCNNRRTSCNDFRYGNCNRQIECYGAIACRVVSCTPPYELYAACDRTTLWDDSTANHSAECLSPEPPGPPVGAGDPIISAFSGKALDVRDKSLADGAAIQQWSPSGASNQRWAAEALGDGSFRIVAAHSGKVLDVAEFSRADGGRIHQWTWNGTDNQKWRIENLGAGLSKITSVHSGKVLDVAEFSRADGGRIHQWAWNDTANQKWQGLTVESPPPPRLGVEILAVHSGKALDVRDKSLEDGALIQQWSPSKASNQSWSLEQLPDGTYRIVSVHSGKVLDVAEFSRADGGRIHQWRWNGTDNQRWTIENLGDGTAKITSVHSGKVLDVAEFSTADGARVHQWTWNGTANQRWRGVL